MCYLRSLLPIIWLVSVHLTLPRPVVFAKNVAASLKFTLYFETLFSSGSLIPPPHPSRGYHPPVSPYCQAKGARDEAEAINVKRKMSQEAAERTLWNLARKRAEGSEKSLQIQLACEGLRAEVKRLKTAAAMSAANVKP